MAAILPASPPLPIFPSNPRARRLSTILPNLSRWNNANPQSSVAPLRLHRRYQSASNLLTPQNQRENDQQPPRRPPASKSKGTPSQPSSPSKPPTEARRKHQNQHQRHQHPAFRPFSAPALPAPCTGDGVSFKIEGAPFEFQYSYTETPKVKPVALRAPLFTPFGPQTMPRPWTGRAPLPKSRKKLPEFDSFRPPPPGMKGVKPVQLPGPFLPGSGPRYTVSREELLGEPLTEEEVKELVRGCMKTNRQLNIGRDGLTHNMLDNIHSHWKRRRVCKIKCKGVCTVDLDNVKHQLEEKTGGKVIHSSGGAMFLFRGRNYNYKTHPKFPLMLWKPTPPVYPRLVQRIPEGLTLEEATNMRKKGHQLPPICRLAKNGVYHKLVSDVREAFEVCELVRIDCTSLKSNDTRKIGAKLKDLVPCILMSFQFEHILLWRGKDWKSSLGLAKVSTTGPELVTDSTLSVDSCGPDRQIFTELVTDSALAVDSPEPDRQIFTELDTILDSEVDSFSAESCSEGEDVDTDNETLDSSEKASIVFDNIDDGAIGSLPGSWNEGTNCDDDKGLLNGTCNNIATGNSVPKGDECAQTGGNILESEENIVSEDLTIDAMLLNDNSSSMFSISNLGQNSSHTRSGATGGTIAMSKPEHSSSVEFIATPGSTRLDGNDAMIARSGDVEATVNPNSIHIKNDKRRHCTDGIMALLKQAIENGRAVSLEGDSLDADLVYKSAVDLAKTAPPGPVFTHEYKKSANQIKKTDNGGAKKDNDQNQDQDIQPIAAAAAAKPTSKKGVRQKSKNEIKSSLPTIVPHGTLKVDELVKLLS